MRTQCFVNILNVSTPPPPLLNALCHAIKRAVIKHQRKRHEGEAGAGEQLKRFSLLSQQDITELEQLKKQTSSQIKTETMQKMILGLQRTSTLPWNPFLPFQHKKRLSSDKYSCNTSRCSNQRAACGAHLSQLRHAVTPIFQDRRIRRLCFIKSGVIFRIRHCSLR
jgi:hypothetical protein